MHAHTWHDRAYELSRIWDKNKSYHKKKSAHLSLKHQWLIWIIFDHQRKTIQTKLPSKSLEVPHNVQTLCTNSVFHINFSCVIKSSIICNHEINMCLNSPINTQYLKTNQSPVVSLLKYLKANQLRADLIGLIISRKVCCVCMAPTHWLISVILMVHCMSHCGNESHKILDCKSASVCKIWILSVPEKTEGHNKKAETCHEAKSSDCSAFHVSETQLNNRQGLALLKCGAVLRILLEQSQSKSKQSKFMKWSQFWHRLSPKL